MPFASGRVAMRLFGRGQLAAIKQAGATDFDVTYVPRGAGGRSGAYTGGGGFAVTSASKHREESYQLVRFTASPAA